MKRMVKESASVLDSAASTVRLSILKLLAGRGPLSYTEIMFEIKLDPIRDAGKFVYHLKNLVQSDLISIDKKSKKYEITDLGRLIVNFSRDLDEYLAVKKGQMYVRSSRLAIEEFDRSKISNSLVTEAGMPLEIAEDIASEAEERLIKLKTKYLTAPLIREFINSILVERKLEEYRHKLTRVGMPLYDVTQLIEKADKTFFDVNSIEVEASSSLMEEYVLLNAVSREVADAHLSGLIHIDKVADWVLKPSEISHDLRFILKEGILDGDPPKNFMEALTLLPKMFQSSISESSGEVLFDEFNIFLSPYIKSIEEDQIGELLILFLKNLDLGFNPLRTGVSLGLETSIPKYIAETESIGPMGKHAGYYKDYVEESHLILKILLEKINEYLRKRPLFNPRLILKLRRETYREHREEILSKVRPLVDAPCSLFFAVLGEDEKISYTADGLRLSDEWSGNWKFDCLRTGNIGTVFLNMPRVAFESKGNHDRFSRLMEKSIGIAVEALKSKGEAVRKRMKQGALPIISTMNGSPYFMVDNASYTISFIGLPEAMMIHHGIKSRDDKEIIDLSFKQVENLNSMIDDVAEKFSLRIGLAQRPSDIAVERLARLDIEKYGRNVKKKAFSIQGYNSFPIIPNTVNLPIKKYIAVESRFQSVLRGGHLTVFPVSKKAVTRFNQVEAKMINSALYFFTFSKELTYCKNCRRSYQKLSKICNNCGSNKTQLLRKYFGIMRTVIRER